MLRELSTGDGVIRMAASTGREALRETLSTGLPTSRASSKAASICSNCALTESMCFLASSALPQDNTSSRAVTSRTRTLGVSLSSVATDVITRESSVATSPWPCLMQAVDSKATRKHLATRWLAIYGFLKKRIIFLAWEDITRLQGTSCCPFPDWASLPVSLVRRRQSRWAQLKSRFMFSVLSVKDSVTICLPAVK